MTGQCDGGCGGVATRELLDPLTRVRLGTFVCEYGARDYGLHNTRRLPMPAPASIPDADMDASAERSISVGPPASRKGRGLVRSMAR